MVELWLGCVDDDVDRQISRDTDTQSQQGRQHFRLGAAHQALFVELLAQGGHAPVNARLLPP